MGETGTNDFLTEKDHVLSDRCRSGFDENELVVVVLLHFAQYSLC